MKVLKFGGTSVGTAARIKNVAALLASDEKTIVVLSAMAGTTNALIDIANATKSKHFKNAIEGIKMLEKKYYCTIHELFEQSKYKILSEALITTIFDTLFSKLPKAGDTDDFNEIIAFGEIISSELLHLYLCETGVKSALLPALEFMKTNSCNEPDFSYIKNQLKKQINARSDVSIFITQGFICRNSNGAIANLGRGGSDYTAAIIANTVNSSEVQIWTDIDGLHNNDPRYVQNTKPIRNLSFEEAAELAYFGAKILHPATIYPCSIKNIPVILKNTLAPSDPGTLISDCLHRDGIKAVAAKDGITAIKIRSSRMLMAHGFLKKVFEIFDAFRTPVDMITTSEVSVSLTIDNCKHLEQITEQLKQFSSVYIDHNQSIICVVGDFVAEKPGYANRVFNTLQHIPIRMISYGGSNNNISILVDSSLKIQALQALHTIVNKTPIKPLLYETLN